MSNFDKLFKQIMYEYNQKILKETKTNRKRIVKEGLFTGDNNVSLNIPLTVSGNDVNVSDNNISDNTTDLSLPLPIGEDGQQEVCKWCHGTGYLKSHSDDPDMPCPHCNSAIPDNIGYDSDNLRDPQEVTDAQIDDIIQRARRKRLGHGFDDMYSQSSVQLPDEIIKCEICGKETTHKVRWDKHTGKQYMNEEFDFSCEDPEFTHEHICMDCAQKEAQKYQEKFINGEDQNEHILQFIDNEHGDNWIACASCGTLYPEDDLKDTDSGRICDDCIDEYDSRGQEYIIYHNRNRY